jgi:hypothetical protein
VSIHESIEIHGVFFEGQNQFFPDTQLPSRVEKDTNVGNGFGDNAAWHRNAALPDDDEQNYWFA